MKSLLLLALALAAFVALPGSAEAQSGGGPSVPAVLQAHGKGSVAFGGVGHFRFRLHDSGVLVIRDAASHKVTLLGQGKVTITPGGDMVVASFKGVVSVVGKGVKGHFKQGRLRMKAVGHGAATFIGKGGVRIDGNPAGGWGPPPGNSVSW